MGLYSEENREAIVWLSETLDVCDLRKDNKVTRAEKPVIKLVIESKQMMKMIYFQNEFRKDK